VAGCGRMYVAVKIKTSIVKNAWRADKRKSVEGFMFEIGVLKLFV